MAGFSSHLNARTLASNTGAAAARMLTPMMAAYILHKPKGEHREPGWMSRYMAWAPWCLQHRIETTLAAAAFLVGSLMLVPLLPTGFIPPDDLSQTQLTVSLPPGSTFAQTFAAAEQALCAAMQGFSLHAAVRCGADDRQALEQLCRYITRPALANGHVQTNAAGQAVLKLKTAWRDGTIHWVMSPLEFMQRQAALISGETPDNVATGVVER